MQYKLPEELEGKRADQCLQEIFPGVSRSRIQSAIREGNFLCNGKPFRSSLRMKAGDILEGEIAEEHPAVPTPWNHPIDLRYEDEDILVLMKPSGMVVHPSPGHEEETLVHALLGRGEHLSLLAGADRPGIVHRLDKDTSGLMVIAKTDRVYEELKKSFFHHRIYRVYLAILRGHLPEEHMLLDGAMKRDEKNRLKRVFRINSDGKRAVSECAVMEEWKGSSLVAFRLHTGRTHQIRAQAAYLQHPVLGDALYGGRKPYTLDGFSDAALKSLRNKEGQYLHAACLGFYHPVTGEKLLFYASPEDSFLGAADLLREKKADYDMKEKIYGLFPPEPDRIF